MIVCFGFFSKIHTRYYGRKGRDLMPKEQVGYALHALNTTVRRFIENYSHKRENEQLTGANTWVLYLIAENPDRPVYLRDVEQRFGITRSTASKSVDLLVCKGFVERHAEDTDARLRRLVLTEKAKSLLETIRQDHCMVENELLNGFTDEEVNAALNYLHRMKNNMDAAEAKRQKSAKGDLS